MCSQLCKSLYVRTCLCMYVCTCARVCTCLCTCARVYVCVCVYVCARVHLCVRVRVCACTCVYVYVYVYVDVCVRVRVCVYVYVYTKVGSYCFLTPFVVILSFCSGAMMDHNSSTCWSSFGVEMTAWKVMVIVIAVNSV